MKLLNFGTTKLGYLSTIGQSSCNRHGLGYTDAGNTIAIFSKTMFVKVAPSIEVSHVFGKTFNPLPSKGKIKIFVPIFPSCNMPDHIHLRYFKYLNTF